MPKRDPRIYRKAKVVSLRVRAEYKENQLEMKAVKEQITKLQEELAFMERHDQSLKRLSRRTVGDIADKMAEEDPEMDAKMQEIRDRAGSDDPKALKAAFEAVYKEMPVEDSEYDSFSDHASDEETSDDESEEEMELDEEATAVEEPDAHAQKDNQTSSAETESPASRPRARAQGSSTSSGSSTPGLSTDDSIVKQAEIISLRARADYEAALLVIDEKQDELDKIQGVIKELKRLAARPIPAIVAELNIMYLKEAWRSFTGMSPPTSDDGLDDADGETRERDAQVPAKENAGTHGRLQGAALAASKFGPPVRKIAGRSAPKKARSSKAGNHSAERAEAAQPEGSRSAQRPSGSSSRQGERRA